MQSIPRLMAIALLSAGLVALPAASRAQTATDAGAKKAAPAAKSAGGKKSISQKKQRSLPFNGELTASDKAAKTFTVGKRTFQVTSETRFYRGTKTPATFGEGVVGEVVRGSYRKAEDGKLLAVSVFFGPKTDGKTAEKTGPAGAPGKKRQSAEKL